MTPNDDLRPVSATPVRATAIAGVVLFTDILLGGLAIPVLPLLPSAVGQGEATTGILFSSYAAAMIVTTFFTGRAVDQRGPKGPLLTKLIVLVAATLLFATGGPYWLLLVAHFVQGITSGIAWVAALFLIAVATGAEKQGQMMGIAMSTATLGVLAGPPLGGFLVDAFGPASPFLIAAAIAIVDVALLLAPIPGSPRQNDGTAGPFTVLRVRGSASIVAAIGIGAAVPAAVQPVLPGRIGEQLSASTIIGVLFGIATLAGIIANPIVGHLMTSTTPRLLVGVGIVAVVAALLVIGWSFELWQIGIGMGFLGLSSVMLLAPATTLTSEQGSRSEPSTLGGSFALYNLAYAAGLTIGPLLTGFGVQQTGFTTAMAITALVFAVLGGVALVRLPAGPARTTE